MLGRSSLAAFFRLLWIIFSWLFSHLRPDAGTLGGRLNLQNVRMTSCSFALHQKAEKVIRRKNRRQPLEVNCSLLSYKFHQSMSRWHGGNDEFKHLEITGQAACRHLQWFAKKLENSAVVLLRTKQWETRRHFEQKHKATVIWIEWKVKSSILFRSLRLLI